MGWLAEFSDGPYPSYYRKLVVFENGVSHTFLGQPTIWNWAFFDRGRRVGYMEMAAHGSNIEYFKLREVATGSLIASYALSILDQVDRRPDWVKRIDRLQ